MRILTPHSYDDIINAIRYIYTYTDEATSFDSSLPQGYNNRLNITIEGGLIIGSITESTYTQYDYRSLYLTDSSNEVYAIIILDEVQSITAKTLTLRITINYSEEDPEGYTGVVTLGSYYSVNNQYAAPQTTSLVYDHNSAVNCNKGQYVWRNLITSDRNFFNCLAGLSFPSKVISVLYNVVDGFVTLDVECIENLLYKFNLSYQTCWINNSIATAPEGFSTYRINYNPTGFWILPHGRDLLSGSVMPEGYVPNGVIFQCSNRDRDLMFINEDQIQLLGITFELASQYLGVDVTDASLNIRRYLTDTYSIFYNENSRRMLVIEIRTGLPRRFICNNFKFYPLDKNFITDVEHICDSNWDPINSPGCLIDILTETPIYPDRIPLFIYEQKYWLVDNQTRLNNIL